MGNRCSNQNRIVEKKCMICLTQIDVNRTIKCIRCQGYLHGHCDVKSRNNRNYNKCPICQQIGTMCVDTNTTYVYSK